MYLRKHDIVLFQGDSLTDGGRNREEYADLGHAYPLFIAGLFGAQHPDMDVTFLNRGNACEKVCDLGARWQKDCLELKPTVLSLMAGINDVWRRYDGANDTTSPEKFYKDYRYLLQSAKEQFDVRFILMDCFNQPCPADRRTWREDLDPKIQVIRQLAEEFHALYIPLDGIFAQKFLVKGGHYWTSDGVHPTSVGNALIAQKWMEAVEAYEPECG